MKLLDRLNGYIGPEGFLGEYGIDKESLRDSPGTVADQTRDFYGDSLEDWNDQDEIMNIVNDITPEIRIHRHTQETVTGENTFEETNGTLPFMELQSLYENAMETASRSEGPTLAEFARDTYQISEAVESTFRYLEKETDYIGFRTSSDRTFFTQKSGTGATHQLMNESYDLIRSSLEMDRSYESAFDIGFIGAIVNSYRSEE